MADTKHEADAVRRLLDTLGEPYAHLADPKGLYGHETGADVQIEHSGRKVGIQVTDYAVDEATRNQRRGMRGIETRNAKQAQYPTYSLPLTKDRRAALRLRVLDKIEKARRLYTFSHYDDVWLLVAAGLARDDAVASTFPVPALMNTDELNADLDRELRASKYARAYVHVQTTGTVFAWTPDARWRRIDVAVPFAEAMGAEDVIRLLRDPGSIGPLPVHPQMVEMICVECGGPLVRDYPRREPARADGRYVHADEAWCAHIKRVTVRGMPGLS